MALGRFQCPPSVDSLLKNRGTNVNYNSNVQVFTNKLNTNRETNRSRRRGTPDGAGALARDMVARRDVGGGGELTFGTVVVYFGEERVQLEGLGLVPGRGPRLVQHAVCHSLRAGLAAASLALRRLPPPAAARRCARASSPPRAHPEPAPLFTIHSFHYF